MSQPDPTISLSADGAIALSLGAHTIRIPVGQTAHDHALAMSALLRLLRDRQQADRPPTIAQPGCLTQDQLNNLLRVMKGQPEVRRIAPSATAKRPAPQTLSLEDLDLG